MKTDRVTSKLAGTLAFSVVLCFAAPGPAPLAGQEGTLSLTAGAGIGLPASDLSDVSDPGPAFRFGTEYALDPALGILGSIQVEVFESVTGPGGEGPTVRLFRFLVGPAFTLVPSEEARGFRLDVNGGAGVTLFSAGRTLVGTGANVRTIELDRVYPGLGGGLSAGYRFSRSLGAFLSAGVSFSFADEEDTEGFTFLDPAVEPFSSLVSLPVTAGVRLDFPR